MGAVNFQNATTTLQVAALTTAELASMTTLEVAAVKTVQLAALSTAQIAALSSTQMQVLRSEHIRALTTAKIDGLLKSQTSAFNSSQLIALTTDQIKALRTANVASLLPGQLTVLSTAQTMVLGLTGLAALGVDQIAALSFAQVAVLSTGQIRAINASAIVGFDKYDVAALSTAQVLALMTDQINALGVLAQDGDAFGSKLALLSSAQILALGTAQLVAMTTQALDSLSTAQFAAMQTAQIGAMNTSQVANLETADLAALSTLHIATLKPAQLSAINAIDIAVLSAPQLVAVSTLQLQALTTGQIVSLARIASQPSLATGSFALTTLQVSTLTTAQISALGEQALIWTLNTAQMVVLNTGQIRSLNAVSVRGLSPDQIAALQPLQFSAMNTVGTAALSQQQLLAINTAQAAALTTAQVLSLADARIAAIENVDFAAIKADVVAAMRVSQISALQTAQLAVLSQATVIALRTSQVNGLQTSQVMSLGTNQLTTLSTAQLSALVKNQDTFISLTTRQAVVISGDPRINILTASQVEALASKQVASLTTAHIGNLLASQLQALTTSQFGAMRTGQIAALSTAQFMMLETADLAALSSAQVASISIADIRILNSVQAQSLRTMQIAALSTAQLVAVSSAGISALDNSQTLAFSTKQVLALGTSQLVALAKTAIGAVVDGGFSNAAENANSEILATAREIALGTAQIVALSTGQLNALGAASLIHTFGAGQIQALTSTHLTGLSAVSLDALSDGQELALRTAQVISLKTSQIAAIGTEAINAFGTAQIAAMTSAQIASLTAKQVANFEMVDLLALGTTQIAALNTAGIEAITVAQMLAITTSQIQALNSAQIRTWNSEQIAAITSAQASALTTAQFQLGFSTAQLAAIETRDIAAIKTAAIASLRTAQVRALTPAQVALGLGTAQLAAMVTAEIAAFATAAVAALTTAQIILGLSTAQVGSLTTAQVSTLTIDTGGDPDLAVSYKVTVLTTAQLGALSTVQLGALGTVGVQALTTAQIQQGLSTSQIASLAVRQIGALRDFQTSALSTAQVLALTTTQIGVLTTFSLNALSDLQFKALNTAQVAAITTAQFPNLETADMAALTTAQVAAISTADIALLSKAEVIAMTTAQWAALTSAQIGVIARDDWAVLGTSQLVALKTSQLSAINTAAIGGFSTAHFAALTTQQISGLSAGQIVGLAKAANDAVGIYAGGGAGGSLGGQPFAGGLSDAMVARYLADGTGFDSANAASAGAWVRLLGTASNGPIGAKNYGREGSASLARAPDGSVYSVGYVRDTINQQSYVGSDRDAYLVKYGPDGSVRWTQMLGTTGSDTALSVAVGANGLIYVGGVTSGALPGASTAGLHDCFVITFKDEGTSVSPQTTKQFGTTGVDLAWSITVTSDGSLFVAGEISGIAQGANWDPGTDWHGNGQTDGFVTKFNPNGSTAWTRIISSWPNKPNDLSVGSGFDANRYVKVGNDGSVYGLGSTTGSLDNPYPLGYRPVPAGGLEEDAYLIKYNADGSQAWTQMLGVGPQWVQGRNLAMGLAIGPDGTLVVTGSTTQNLNGKANSGGEGDLFVLKYATDGAVLWTQLYGTEISEEGLGITVGPDGSVYVGGDTWSASSFVPSGPEDGLLIKYSADGALVWKKQVDSGGSDRVSGLAIDPSYIVLNDTQVAALSSAQLNAVGGASLMSTLSLAQVAALSSAQINTLSTQAITGLSQDQIAALKLSQVVAISTSDVVALKPWQLLALTTTQVAALTTVQGWSLTTAQVLALENRDLTAVSTATLSALATSQISAFLTSQAMSLSTAQVVALKTNQIAAISTVDLAALRTNQLGVISASQIVALTTGQVLALAQAANNAVGLFVAGTAGSGLGGQSFAGGNSDAMVARYLADGTGFDSSNAAAKGAWVRLLGSNSSTGVGTRLSGMEVATSPVRAPDGSVYCVGMVRGGVNGLAYAGGDRDAYLIKYAPDGSTVWTQLLGSPGSDTPLAVTLGPNSLLYVCGATSGVLPGAQANAGGTDLFVVTYRDDGDHATPLETKEYGVSWGTFDIAWSVSVAQDGSLYVAGEVGQNGILSKFQPDGSMDWTRTVASWPVKSYDIPWGGTDSNRFVKVAADGSAIVLGITTGKLDGPAQGASPTEDAYLIKYNADGSTAWSKMLGVGPQDMEQRYVVMGLALGPDGSICVTGRTALNFNGQTNQGAQDAFVAKYGVDGSLIWSQLYGSDKFEEGVGVTVGPDGSVYIGGRTSSSTNSANLSAMDGLLIKYSANGALVWTKQAGAAGVDWFSALAVDPSYLALNTIQVAALSTSQINALSVGGMMSTLSTAQLTALGTLQVTALSTLSVTSLSQDQIASLKNAQIVAITSANIAALKQSQIVALTSAQAEAMTSVQVLTLSLSQVAALVPGDFAALNTAAMGSLRTAQFSALGTAQLTALTSRQLSVFGSAQIGAMTTGQLIALANNAIGVYAAGMASSAMDGQTYAGGKGDTLLVRYSADGNKVWTRMVGTDSMVGASSSGAIYIAGYSAGNYDGLTNAGSNDGYLTKYSFDGTKLWSKLIGTTTSDEIGGVAVSTDGMITVTGRTTGNLDGNSVSGPSDIFLAQFSQDGQKIYSKMLGGTGEDVGSAITIDAAGSIVLAGQTDVAFDGQILSAPEDGVVIKLNADGIKQWTRILGSSSSGASYSVSIGLDGAYYVAGRANNQGSLTKYAPDGTKVWAKAIDADHVLNSGGNAVYSVATSVDGSVYITGPKLGDMDGQTSNGGNDAFVIKYSSDGAKQWTKLLGTAGTDAGYMIKTGSDGSVYVAGETGSQSGAANAFLTKLAPSGNVLWTQKLQGTVGTSTGARGLTITSDGSAYMTGYTNTNLDGQIAVGGRDIYLAKFASSGEKLWTRISGSTATDEPSQAIAYFESSTDASAYLGLEEAISVTSAPDGSLYVVGYVRGDIVGETGNGSACEAYLSKYTSDGARVWTRLIGPAGGQWDWATSVTVGVDGMVYLSGETSQKLSDDQSFAGGGSDVFVAKYDPSGTAIWSKLIGSVGSDNGWSIRPAADGSLMLVGEMGALPQAGVPAGQIYKGGSSDAFVTKLTAAGDLIWTQMLGTSHKDRATATAIGIDGCTYVAGKTAGNLSDQTKSVSGDDVFVSKYNADGSLAWTRLMGSGSPGGNMVGLVTSPDGFVYVSHKTTLSTLDGQANPDGADAYLIKLDSNGDKVWTRLQSGPNWQGSGGLAIGPDAAIYMSGWTSNTADNYGDGLIVKFSPDGALLWSQQFGGPGEDWFDGLTVAVGNIALGTQQLVSLSTGQINSLGAASLICTIGTSQLQALTIAQVAGLDSVSARALALSQVAGFGTWQVKAINTMSINALASTQLTALRPAQVAALSTAQVVSLSTYNLDALTTQQYVAMGTAQIAVLTTAQAINLETADFAALGTAQIVALSTADIAALSTAEIVAITTGQIQALTTAQARVITTQDMVALESVDLQALMTAQVVALTTAAIVALGSERLDHFNCPAFAPVIELGTFGKLIKPVLVDGGKLYYFWDANGDGTSAGESDFKTQAYLDGIFNQDIDGKLGPGYTTPVYRFTTINGVQLALPTLGAVASPPYGPNGPWNPQPGTSVGSSTALVGSNQRNATYDDYLAIWDAFNGRGTGTLMDGTPPGWSDGQRTGYAAASPQWPGYRSSSASFRFSNQWGDAGATFDRPSWWDPDPTWTGAVAVQVISDIGYSDTDGSEYWTEPDGPSLSGGALVQVVNLSSTADTGWIDGRYSLGLTSLTLDPGSYRIQYVQKNELPGANFDAWGPWGGLDGTWGPSFSVKTESGYIVRYWEVDDMAKGLDAAIQIGHSRASTFSLSAAGKVDFFITDTYLPDNAGGVSLAIYKISSDDLDDRGPHVVSFSTPTYAIPSPWYNQSQMVVTFSEAIQRGMGNVALRDSSGNVVVVFDVTDVDHLRFLGNQLFFDSTVGLNDGKVYTVEFGSNAVKDLSGNRLVGPSAYTLGYAANDYSANFYSAKDTTVFANFTTTQVAALTPQQINALGAVTRMAAIMTAQLSALTTGQVFALSTASVIDLGTAQIPALRTDQIISLTTVNVAVLSTAEIVALTTMQVRTLLTSQIQAISTRDIVAMQSDDVNALLTTQVAALTTGQILALAQSANNATGLYVGGAAGSGLGGQTFAGGNSDAMVARYLADGTGYDSSNAASADTWLRLLGSDSMGGAGTRQYGHETATSLLRAADGSVYAVGFVRGSVNGEAFAGDRDAYLIKYGRDGNTQWTQLLGSTGTDNALSISMGANGLLYVVGNTTGVLPGAQGFTGGSDIFVATYKDEGDHGTRLDTKEFGTSWGIDVAWSSSAAPDGSLYVAGQANGDGFLTKFQADGNVAWTRAVASWPVKAYDWGSGTDVNRIVKAGADGSAIVLGITTGNLGGPAAQGTTPSADAYLIKYNADGSEAWSKMLGVGPQDVEQNYRTMGLALGPDGSMCVTGRTALDIGGQCNKGNQDTFLAKYAADGSLIWSRLYGSENFDEGVGVTVGLDGAIYVSGRTSPGPTSLGPDGSWSPSMDSLLLKYSPDGILQWSKRVGANGADMLLALAIDPSYLALDGAQVAALTSVQINVLGVGSMMSTLSTGQVIALSTAQIVALSTQSIMGLSQDQVGAFKTAQVVAISSTDVAALKATQIAALVTAQAAALTSAQIQSFGQTQLTALVPTDFVALSTAVLAALRTDQINVLSTAQLTALSTRQIAVLGTAQIAALNSTQLIGLANDAIAVYASGIASSAMDGQTYAGGNGDALLVRYSANGSRVWTRLFGTNSMVGIEAPGMEEAMSVATGADGSVYTVGYVRGNVAGQAANGSACEAYISKYDSDGTMLWTRLIGAVGTHWDWATSVTLGADGMLYVSGETSGKLNATQAEVSGDSDVFVAKYDDKGVQQWSKLIGSVGADTGWYIRAGVDGNLVLVGAMSAIPQQAGVANGQTYGGGSKDAFITKINATGDVLWTQMLGSSAKDVASAVAMGDDGVMYVAGRTGGNLTGQIKAMGDDDFFVSKYNTDGSLAWTRLMGSGAAGGNGNMVGLVRGADGFVYFAARTNRSNLDGQSNPGGEEAFLIKLDAAGNKVWTRLATGPSWQGSDVLAMGPDGAIYMGGWTGLTADNGGDALLVKFLPDGTKVWSQQFGGLGEDWFDGLAVAAGNLALSTRQVAALSASQLNTLGAAALICTIGTSQVQALTTAQIAGLNTVSIRALANSQVAGFGTLQVNAMSSVSLNAFATNQLTALRLVQVIALSTAQVVSLGTYNLDALTTQQFAGMGTAQIAGLTTAQVASLETADFAALGPAQIAALSTAQIVVLSTAEMVAITTSQMPSFTTLQVRAFETQDIVAMQTEDVRAMATAQIAALTTAQVVALVGAHVGGNDGSVIAVGGTLSSFDGQLNHGNYDGFITKYAASGTREWTRLVGTGSDDWINSASLGADGSVTVSGVSNGNLEGVSNPNNYDQFVSKYAADGTRLWTRFVGTSSVQSVIAGADGSVLVSGSTYSNLDGEINHGNEDGFITKYDADGTRLWSRLVGTTSEDYINSSASGVDGSVVVAGVTNGSLENEVSQGGVDGFISKYAADGTRLWTRMVSSNSWDLINTVAMGADGSVLVSGSTGGNLDGQANHGNQDGFISKYAADGTRLWTQLIGTSGSDWINSLNVGADGSVLVNGVTTGNLDGESNPGDYRQFISKYAADGTRQWTRLLGMGSWESKTSLASDGSVAISEQQWGQNNNEGYLGKLASNGTPVWTRVVGTDGYDYVSSVTTDADGAVLVAGYTQGNLDGALNHGNFDGFISKYSPDGTLLWTRLIGGGEDDWLNFLAMSLGGVSLATALSASQVMALTSAGLNALGSNDLIRVLSTEQIAALTTAQMPSLTTLSINAFNANQLIALRTVQASALTTAQVQSLTTGNLDAFSTMQFAWLGTAQIAALTTAQVLNLETADFAALRTDQLNSLTTSSIAVLSTAEMVALTTAQTKSLGTTQIQALTTRNLAAMESADLRAMVTAQVAALTTAQVVALLAPTPIADGSWVLAGEAGAGLNGQSTVGSADGFIAKYDANGQRVWTRLIGSSQEDWVLGTITGSDNSMLVGGNTYGSFDGQTNKGTIDGFITKYMPDGSRAWTRMVGSDRYDQINAMVSGGKGALIVVGETMGSLEGESSQGGQDGFISKYDANGTRVWSNQFGSQENDAVLTVSIGADGALLVGGYTGGDLEGETYQGMGDGFIRKYAADGTLLWTRILGSTQMDWVKTSAIGADGSLLIGGVTFGDLDGNASPNHGDGIISKFDADGNVLWTRLVTTGESDTIMAMTLTGDGSVLVAGTTFGDLDGQTNAGNGDGFISKFDPQGNWQWTRLAGTNQSEQITAIISRPDGAIGISGYAEAGIDGQTGQGGGDAFFSEYDADGNLLLTRVVGSDQADAAYALESGLRIETRPLALGASQIAALSSAQLGGLGVMNLLVGLSTEQVVSLSTVQVSGLSPRAVDGLLWGQLIALETKQIAALTSAQLRGLSTDSLNALTTLQYNALTTAQIASLTTGQIPSLESADIVALSTAQIVALSTTQIQALSTSGLAAMETVDLRAMGTAQIAALTTAQVVGMTGSYGRYHPSSELADLSVINLGEYGKLIKPVHVDGGKVYYYWDRSGDGSSANVGTLNGGTDLVSANALNDIFNLDVNGVKAPDTVLSSEDITAGVRNAVTATYRYATLNGVRVALPTMGGVAVPGDLEHEYGPNGHNAPQPGTAVGAAVSAEGSNVVNSQYDDLLAVWDAYNGTGTGTYIVGTPPGWAGKDYYLAADAPWPNAFSFDSLSNNQIGVSWQNISLPGNVALQVFLSDDGYPDGTKFDALRNAPKLLPITTTQVCALSSLQLNALGEANLISVFTTDQVVALTSAQLRGLSTDSLNALTTLQYTALTTAQIASLTTGQMPNLETADFVALSTAQIVALSTAQVEALSTNALMGMETVDVQVMTSSQIAALTTAQLSFLPCGLSSAQKAALTTAQIAAYIATPIMLDLNGDGVQTLGLDAGVQFDVRANGLPMRTGWVSAQDGLLVRDRNGDGSINDGSELFGSSTVLAGGVRATDGYQALAELDSNGDGLIDRLDTVFAQLRVWVDATSDGLSAPDELRSLEDWGITSISTQAFASTQVNHGNVLGLVSSYQTSDGQTHQAADVWFGAALDDVVPTAARVNALTQALGEFAHTQATPSKPEAVTSSPTQPATSSALAINQSLVAALQNYQNQAQSQQAMACANGGLNPPANLAAMAAPVESSTRLGAIGLSPSDPQAPFQLAALR